MVSALRGVIRIMVAARGLGLLRRVVAARLCLVSGRIETVVRYQIKLWISHAD